ncbi:MAG: enoyl-CoA hydratase/isomerase family protein [Gammaproteobacteria bacterium]|nr:enoyl-CoA hydratase/isomerase family protein [Gammaproteobacteria bacterium]
MTMMGSDSVLFSQIILPGGRLLAHAELNVPSTLNSLSLEMIHLLQPKLDEWAHTPGIAAVLITGAGDRAFCAGGDIQALYHAIRRNHEAGKVVDTYPFDFFEREYRLDYCLHTFPKPVVVLGHGVVMGGGLGILSAASHRVLTEKSRVAIPEITIGLFPDAGTTWLLKNMPEHLAVFTGMTGSHCNAADAMVCGVGTVVVDSTRIAKIRDGIAGLILTGNRTQDDRRLTDFLRRFETSKLPASELAAVPKSLSAATSLTDTVVAIRKLSGTSAWIDRCITTMNSGCATSIGVVHEQIRRCKSFSLADAFRMEMVIATHCATNREFAEGVRALLIDKDNAPKWSYPSLESLPSSHIKSHFAEPWPVNPLADLDR